MEEERKRRIEEERKAFAEARKSMVSLNACENNVCLFVFLCTIVTMIFLDSTIYHSVNL